MQESNWFSAPSALRVYGQYLNLDKDHNGMLSKEELSRYINVAVQLLILYNGTFVIRVCKIYVIFSALSCWSCTVNWIKRIKILPSTVQRFSFSTWKIANKMH